MDIAFLGLGRMGAPMAANLVAAGHTVLGYDPHLADAATVADAGVRLVTALDDLATTDVSVSMLPSGAVAQAVLAADDGLFARVSPGHLHLHMGTIGPVAVRSLRDAADAHGVHLVDAPVSGSVPAAQAATLTTMVGGTSEDVEAAAPVLAAMTSRQTPVGAVGDGSTVKLAINAIITAMNQSIAEALLLVEAEGVAPEVFYDVLEASAVATPYATYKRSVYLTPDEAPVIATMTVIAKDIRLAQEMASAHGLSMPLVDATDEALTNAVESGEADLDCAQITRAVRRLSARHPV